MPISIPIQPSADSFHVAYRPINLKALLPNLMPIVFCDVYFNNIFYKTISSTISSLEIIFDIQDAAQEYLTKYLPSNGNSTILPASGIMSNCYCKIRGSSVNSEGLIDIEGNIPIQATGGTPAQSGDGIKSNTFYILNSTLQHEDNQNLLTHLSSFKQNTWHANAYPLTHRKNNYKVASSDFFPILNNSNLVPSCLKLYYTLSSGGTGLVTDCTVFPSCPIITGITISSVDNADTTQTFTFGWSTPDPLLTNIEIQYKPNGTGTWIPGHMAGLASGHTWILPLGLMDFRFIVYGACNPTTSASFEGYGVTIPSCTPTGVVGSPALPDATVNTAYFYEISLTGSQPFDLVVNSKPSWMTIAIIADKIRFTGTPLFADITPSVLVDISVTNCSVSPYNFSDTIEVKTIVISDNSTLHNNTGLSSSAMILLKTTSPTQFLINSVALAVGETKTFYCPNFTGVDIQFWASGLVAGSATLTSNGNTYTGIVSGVHIAFLNVDIVNSVAIEIYL